VTKRSGQKGGRRQKSFKACPKVEEEKQTGWERKMGGGKGTNPTSFFLGGWEVETYIDGKRKKKVPG